MRRIALEGIDGSGKSSVASEFIKLTAKEGLHSKVYPIHRIANEIAGEDLYRFWFDSDLAVKGAAIVQLASEQSLIDAEENNVDIALFDRHWMTIAATMPFSESTELLGTSGLEIAETALIRVDPVLGYERKLRDLDPDIHKPWMQLSVLKEQSEKYNELALNHSSQMLGIYLSDHATPKDIARAILWDVNIRR